MLSRFLVAAVALLALGGNTPVRAQFSDASQQAAKVISATGQVSVLKDSQPWALSIGDTVQVQQIIVTGSTGHALFQVSDGSTFEVFPNSQVVFRKNPPNWRDLLDLLVGRVKIHIQKIGNTPNPNRIVTPTAVISVRGTTFDVLVNEDDEATLVDVEEGEVAVHHALFPRGAGRILRDGESLRVYKQLPLEARSVDKGTVIRYSFRALIDAINTVILRTSRPGGVPGSGGPLGLPGDKGAPPPPPPPPPPPGN
jgi:ferric-dicitrate binding protein FerR (iron transport regulator)